MSLPSVVEGVLSKGLAVGSHRYSRAQESESVDLGPSSGVLLNEDCIFIEQRFFLSNLRDDAHGHNELKGLG